MIVSKLGNCAPGSDSTRFFSASWRTRPSWASIPHGTRPKAHHVLLRAGKDKTQLIARQAHQLQPLSNSFCFAANAPMMILDEVEVGPHFMSKLDKVLYTAEAHTRGGTAWRSRSSGGYLNVKHSRLGASINGHNPKQLPPLF